MQKTPTQYSQRLSTISPNYGYQSWRKDDVIRNIASGKPYLVIHVFVGSGTMVVDLESKESPTLPTIILLRDYDQYARDSHMKCQEKEDQLEFSYDPVTI